MVKKEFGKDHLYSEIFIEDDEPCIISTMKNNGNFVISKLRDTPILEMRPRGAAPTSQPERVLRHMAEQSGRTTGLFGTTDLRVMP